MSGRTSVRFDEKHTQMITEVQESYEKVKPSKRRVVQEAVQEKYERKFGEFEPDNSGIIEKLEDISSDSGESSEEEPGLAWRD